MERFSQRQGITPLKTATQIESMDDDLRVGLWNILLILYWRRLPSTKSYLNDDPAINILVHEIWLDFFKRPLDTLDMWWPTTFEELRKFYFSASWYQVYDFVEFVAQRDNTVQFVDQCNSVLERERSGYRFIGNILTPVDSELTEETFHTAANQPFPNVVKHLETAMELLGNRQQPDFRNSIKESMSAVEAICRHICGHEKAVLSEALKRIQLTGAIHIHPAYLQSLEKLYAYTSDGDGIRHALVEKSDLTFEDAYFILVTCAAFVNYLIVKAQKAGIFLEDRA